MIEQVTGYGSTPISPAVENGELLRQRNELEQYRHGAKIIALSLAGISLAAIIGALMIEEHTHYVALTALAGFITSLKYGLILRDTNRNLAVIKNSIAKRNEHRHPDDRLI